MEVIERRIYLNLNKAVKRNLNRFPEDFMFQLSQEEAQSLRFQIGMSKPGGGRGGRRYLPYAFTEHGVAMLSSVLNSERAVAMNILIIRAFVKLREILATHKDLARKIEELELRQEVQASHIANIYKIVKSLKSRPREPRRRPIGFLADADLEE